jgi:predicted ATPase/DNA-binding SARP family transcriptional activator
VLANRNGPELGVLGPLEARDASGSDVSMGGPLVQVVLVSLLASGHDPLSPARLVEELWPETPPVNAERTLQVHLSRLRKRLADGLDGTVVLERRGVGYVVRLDGCSYDADNFERLCSEAERAASASPARAAALYREALGLWRGAALAEFANVPMLAAEGRRLADRKAAAIEGLAEALLNLGEAHEARRVIAPLVSVHPLREGPRSLLMRSLYREGRHADALEQFSLAVVALDEFGLQPGSELRRLHEAILRHDLEAGGTSATVTPDTAVVDSAVAATRIGSLQTRSVKGAPALTHPLVGRTLELHALTGMLADAGERLVTIHGQGGMGKTRLALAGAGALDGHYPNGVWFVSLAPLSTAAEVTNEIARALRVGEPATGTAEEAVRAWLSIRQTLLVLDNFEHVMDARELVAGLLAAAPGLGLIVTSREPLGIAGETVLALGPLESEDAAELFLARATAVRPSLSGETGETQPGVIDDICEQLDRLPLALELVAARAALYSLPVLARRLSDRLSLTDPTQRLPARQHTLRAAIDWSYQLLAEEEQSVFQVMALFPGGARIDAVQDTLEIPDLSVVDLLGGLVVKSLLIREEDSDGEPRLRMLPTIRAFAAELPESDAGARMRHAQHFAALGREAAPHMFDAEQGRYFRRFDAERNNLTAALEYLTAHDPAAALGLATRLGNWWDIRGYHSEIAEHLIRLTDRFATADAPDVDVELDLARGRYMVARAIMQQQRFEEAAELLNAAYPVLDRHGDVRTRQRVLAMQATLAQAHGLEAMQAAVEAAVLVAQDSQDDWALGVAAGHMAQLNDAMGNHPQAQIWAECYLGVARRTGNPVHLANATFAATLVALGQGDSAAASSLATESLRHCDAIGHEGTATVVRSLSLAALLLQGDLDGARERLREALDRVNPESQFAGSDLVAAAAGLSALDGSAELAAVLWGYVDKQFGDGRVPISAYLQQLRERCEPEARRVLDAEAWQHGTNQGRELDLQGALAAIGQRLAA